jgi:hypothetical protein
VNYYNRISVPNGFYVGLTAEARRRRVKPSERRNQNEHLLKLLFSSLHLCASAVIFKKPLGTKTTEYLNPQIAAHQGFTLFTRLLSKISTIRQ